MRSGSRREGQLWLDGMEGIPKLRWFIVLQLDSEWAVCNDWSAVACRCLSSEGSAHVDMMVLWMLTTYRQSVKSIRHGQLVIEYVGEVFKLDEYRENKG